MLLEELFNIIEFHSSDLDRIDNIISQQNVGLNVCDKIGRPLLHRALVKSFDILDILLRSRSIDVDIRDSSHSTALHLAVASSKYNEAILLLKRGANIDLCDSLGNTPLHLAAINANYIMLELLVIKGANLNLKNSDEQTPLHILVELGCERGVRLLLAQSRLDPNVRDRDGNSALHLAISKNAIQIFKLLVEDVRVDLQLKNGKKLDPLLMVIKFQRLEMLSALLREKKRILSSNDEQTNPLHFAAEFSTISMLKRIYKRAVSAIDNLDARGNTVAHRAAFAANYEALEFILDKMKNINHLNSFGYGVLHYAANLDDVNLVKILTKREDLELKIRDSKGKTPLQKAIELNRLAVARAIVEHYAKRRESIDEDLKAAIGGKRLEIISFMVGEGYSFKGDLRALMKKAIELDDSLLFKIGILLGADINMRLNSKPLLHLAIEGKKKNIVNEILAHKEKYEFNSLYEGETALFALARNYSKEILSKVYSLIDGTIRNKLGQTATEVAKNEGMEATYRDFKRFLEKQD